MVGREEEGGSRRRSGEKDAKRREKEGCGRENGRREARKEGWKDERKGDKVMEIDREGLDGGEGCVSEG